VYHFI